MKIIELAGLGSAGGALTVLSTKNVVGYIEKIVMDYDDGDTGADAVFTVEEAGVSIPVLTQANLGVADNVFYPRTLANKIADGTAFTDIAEKIFVAGGAMKVVISAGGTSKNFRFLIYISDEV